MFEYEMPTNDSSYITENIIEFYREAQQITNYSDVLSDVNVNTRLKPAVYSMLHYGPEIEKLTLLGSDINYIETRFMINTSYNLGCENHFKLKSKTGIVILQSQDDTDYDYYIRGIEDKIAHLEAAEELLQKNNTHRLKIFTCADSNYLFVFTNKPLQFTTVCQLKMLQWQIMKEKLPNFKSIIIEYYEALMKADKTLFEAVLAKILADDEFKDIIYKDIPKIFTSRVERKRNELERQIARERRTINEYKEALSKAYENLNEYSDHYTALLGMNAEEDTDVIIKYLKKCPYIKNIATYDDSLVITYLSPIIYFDEFTAERIMRNHNDRNQKIIQIFLDKKYELMTQCCIKFNPTNFGVSVYRDLGTKEEAFGHPHIDRYHCFGTHDALVAELAEEGDYLVALNTVTAATLNLNFTDAIVINEMLSSLSHRDRMRFWRNKETGEMVSLSEILKEKGEE